MNDSLIEILLADDDKDDCLIFEEALSEITLQTSFTAVHDGEQLMKHLHDHATNLPQVIFLDLNMPRKNGYCCLVEIKKDPVLKKIPVIVYSTSYDEVKAVMLHENGAHYYICKPADFNELKNVIHTALLLIRENRKQPDKQKFLLTSIRIPF